MIERIKSMIESAQLRGPEYVPAISIAELMELVNALEAAHAEIARVTPLQYRAAPCLLYCEATAFKIEIRNLKAERDALNAERKQHHD